MRKSSFMRKIRSLQKGASHRIVSKCEQIFDSRILDPQDYEDDYRLPRVILATVLWEWYRQVSPNRMPEEKKKLKTRNVGKRSKPKTDAEKMLDTIYIRE